ncbi:MAG: methionine adenosyltransferase domain-containing protein, partial [Proteobacteria bacterium]|nr:methionine adenosyltransferase domain-containing protein [Pseudomonadota bacterium]
FRSFNASLINYDDLVGVPLPGHPDRLADRIVESLVDIAVSRDNDALVGLECAVHTDHVFIDGRIAGGKGKCVVTAQQIDDIARNVYREAGYGKRWIHAPENLKIIQNICLNPLSDDERAIRILSDDQSVVTGYACNHPETNYLPPAHYIVNCIGRKVDAWRRTLPDKFGPDFKVLVQIEYDGDRYIWQRLTLSIQHAENVYATERHELILPVVREALCELESRGLHGIEDLSTNCFILNGMGDFIIGGPEGDNGLSGKKLAIDFYGAEIPIGGGAICGKDPHKVDVAGAFRARELALKLIKERGANAVTVRLGWSPGEAFPAMREAEMTDRFGISHSIPACEMPPEDWFSIASIASDIAHHAVARRDRVIHGYFF